MRTRIGLLAALAVGCIALPPAGAGQPAWVQTQAVQPGTMTIVDGSRTGDALAASAGTVFHSTDFGVTWQPLSPLTRPPGSGDNAQVYVADASANLWYAGTNTNVSASTNRGLTWRTAPEPSFPRPAGAAPMESIDALAALKGSTIALAGWNNWYELNSCAYTSPRTPITTTRDGGRTWSTAYLPVRSGMVLSGRWLDPAHAAVSVVEFDWKPFKGSSGCGANGTGDAISVWITSDGGRHWHRALRVAAGWASAAWADPHTVVAVVESDATARVYRSRNAGKSFDQNPQVLYSNPAGIGGFPSLDFATKDRAWVGAVVGGMFRTDNAGVAWTHELSPADGAFYGVSDFTAMNADRAVMGGPTALITRIGTAPVGAAPVAATPFDPTRFGSTRGGSVAAVVDSGWLHVVFPSAGPVRATLVVPS